MKTDQIIYQYLATSPEAFRVITGGMVLPGAYKFSAPVLKGVERRVDAIFEPQGHDGPVYIIEFQGQSNPAAWYNLLTKIGLYGEAHLKQKSIHGILIFPRRTIDITISSWIGQDLPKLVSAVYLEDFLPELLTKEPDNPFVVIFVPLIIDNDETIKQQAPHLWRTIHNAPEPERHNLEQILVSWFCERFKTLTYPQVLAMFQNLTPLEETRAYQGIIAQGRAEGKVEGRAEGKVEGRAEGKVEGRAEGKVEGRAEGKVEGRAEGKVEGVALVLKRQIVRRFKKLPKWAQARIDTATTEQMEVWAEAIFDAASVEELLKIQTPPVGNN